MSNQPPQITLTVQTGAMTGQVFQVTSGTQTIGRVPDNQIVINDSTISRQHAQISVQPEGVWIQDLGSSNGTFVNGQRITSSTWLKPGDSLQIGTSIVLGVQTPGVPAGAAAGGGSSAGIWIAAIAIALLIALAAGAAAAWFFWPSSDTSGTDGQGTQADAPPPGPNVVIFNPASFAEAQLNKPLLIHASARDEKKVSRAELWVGGRLVATQSSDIPEGQNPFTFAPVWAPTGSGNNMLLVRAYSTDGRVGESGLVPVSVTVPQGTSNEPSTRVVQEGETLQDISEQTDTTVEEIIDMNPGLDLTGGISVTIQLPPGTIIIVPPGPQGSNLIPPPPPFPPLPPPPPPAPLVLIQAGCDVHLHWTPVPGSAGYRIYRRLKIGQNYVGGFLNQVGAGQNSYADPAGNGDWVYGVAALNAANQEISFTGYRQIVLNNCQNPPPPPQEIALELMDFVPDGKDIKCSIGAGPDGNKTNKPNVPMVEGTELMRFPAQLNAPVGVRFACIDWGTIPATIYGNHEKKFFATDIVNNQVIYRGIGYTLQGGAFEVKYRLCLTPCAPIDNNAPVTTGAPETPPPPAGAFPPPTNLRWADDPADPSIAILNWDWDWPSPPPGVDPQTVQYVLLLKIEGPLIPGGVQVIPGAPQSGKFRPIDKALLSNAPCKHTISIAVLAGIPTVGFSISEPSSYKLLDCPANVEVKFKTLRIWNLKDNQPADTTLEINKAMFFVNQEQQEINLGALGEGTHNIVVPPMIVNMKENDDLNVVVQLFDDEVEGSANPAKVIWCFPKLVLPANQWVGGQTNTQIIRPSPAFIATRDSMNPPVRGDCEIEIEVKQQ